MIQYLKFIDLGRLVAEHTPGDLRFWTALGQDIQGLQFSHFRGLCVEWEEGESAKLPEMDHWVRWLCPPGASSLSLLQESDRSCLLRRKIGSRSTVLELLVEDLLRQEGYPRPRSIWECDHFEISSESGAEKERALAEKVLSLGAKSGLFDEETEEIRYFESGEGLSWSDDLELLDSLKRISLEDLLLRWKGLESSKHAFDALRRSYRLSEITPSKDRIRERGGEPLLAKIDKALTDKSSEKAEALSDSTNVGIFKLSRSRYAETELQILEIKEGLQKASSFMDQPVALTCWNERSAHRSKVQKVAFRRYLSSSALASELENLWAVRPLSRYDYISVRRLESLLQENEGLCVGLPLRLNGSASWLGALRNFFASFECWQIGEDALRNLFEWDMGRSSDFDLFCFHSDWTKESIERVFRAFNLEVFTLGKRVDDSGKGLAVLQKDNSLKVYPWVDVVSDGELSGKADRTEELRWPLQDKKTPTYGFEKVSIFPDQYLIRILKSKRRARIHREVDWVFRSNSKAREVRMRHLWDEPLKAQRRSAGENRLFIESFKSGQNIAAVDPKMATVWAIEYCYRELICRGASPDVAIDVAFSINKPVLVESDEKNRRNFAGHAMAIEGLLEALAYNPNFRLSSADLEQVSNPLIDYECEPLINLRTELSSSLNPIFPGFRMSGEFLYVVGPRPAFMDYGSRVLPYVRVMSNHVTKINWDQQRELYELIHQAHQEKMLSNARAIGHGGVAETILDMAMWSQIGIKMKPGLSTIELFSGAPGRFLVGVLPQDEKRFEALVKTEWLSPIGQTGGEKFFGLTLDDYRAEKMGAPKKKEVDS